MTHAGILKDFEKYIYAINLFHHLYVDRYCSRNNIKQHIYCNLTDEPFVEEDNGHTICIGTPNTSQKDLKALAKAAFRQFRSIASSKIPNEIIWRKECSILPAIRDGKEVINFYVRFKIIQ